MMKKVLVVGASGLVGSRFVVLSKDKLAITPVDEMILDITDQVKVINYFNRNNFDALINFAAYTNVDGAEKERGDENGLCYKLNVTGANNLAKICKEKDIFLVQISTDFVFPGTITNPGPYSEEQQPADKLDATIGWYGWTKNLAEQKIKETKVKSSIVRIAYPFYATDFEGKLDFVKNYLKLYDEGKLFPIFTDQTFTPLLVDELVEPLVKIINGEIEGTFHIVSSNTAIPFDFVEYLLKKARDIEGVTQKGSMEEFLKATGRTPRPRLGGLKTEKTQKILKMKFKTWQEMIDEFSG